MLGPFGSRYSPYLLISNFHSPYPCNIFTNTMNKDLDVVLLPYPLSCNWLSCNFHLELCLLESCRPKNIAVRQFCNSLFISPSVSPFFSPFSPTRLFRYYLLPRVQVLPFLKNLTPPWFQNSLPPSPDSDSPSAVISSQTSDYSVDSSHFFESYCPHL